MTQHINDYDYTLPENLIAQFPLAERSASRLLCLSRRSGEILHQQFCHVVDHVQEGDLLVFNNSKVIPARLLGRKASGGKIELLIERVLSHDTCLVHIKASKAPKVGSELIIAEDAFRATVLSREGGLFKLQIISESPIFELLDQYGRIPLPPYIERQPGVQDQDRYQTIYAQPAGAVAAPTAGLHFDEGVFKALKHKRVDTAFLTLHVGAGTFQPLRVETITEHQMHAEHIEVSADLCEKISAVKARGKRVIAVGTTTVRALETASRDGQIRPYTGDTRLFIYPGFRFHCIDAMITNFHLPKSSLLMLVAAFSGYETMRSAYQAAIAKDYRFYSYGDAMLIE